MSWFSVSCLAFSAGLAGLVAAIAAEDVASPPRHPRRTLIHVGAIGAIAAGHLLGHGLVGAALMASGVALAALAAVIWLHRARRPGEDEGDGGGGGPPVPGPEPPPTDWDAFEREFWAHVDRVKVRV